MASTGFNKKKESTTDERKPFVGSYVKSTAMKMREYCQRKIEEFGSFDVCYENDPRRPVLVHLGAIHNDPVTFKHYLTEHSASA